MPPLEEDASPPAMTDSSKETAEKTPAVEAGEEVAAETAAEGEPVEEVTAETVVEGAAAAAEATTEVESSEEVTAEATTEVVSSEEVTAEATAVVVSQDATGAEATAVVVSKDATGAEAAAVVETVPEPKTADGDSAATGENEEVRSLRQAMQDKAEIEGRVIGWNNGGFHVVVGSTTAFCPRSEMELGAAKDPSEYLDKTLEFQVLRVQKKGRRVVLSRAALLRGERAKVRSEARGKLTAGSVVTGRVASLTDFGAFVDLGGVQGLVHVSEMSRQRIEHPSDVLEVGQEVEVKILKLEKGGRRISLSMRALEPDPWQEIHDRFPDGSVVTGKVEKTTSFGAFIELEPGLTGLLPAAVISLPRDASLARVYPPGKAVQVQIVSVDSRRQRISLTLEGSALEGSRNDYKSYVRDQRQSEPTQGFNALADAFRKLDTNKKD